MSSIGSTSGLSSASSSSASRLTGMFSGLDTDAIVKNLTATQQAKIDAVKAKQTRQQWYSDALQSVRDKIDEFVKTYISVTGANSMLKSSAYVSYKAVTSSTSGAVSVSGSAAASEGAISVQVNRLAANSSVSSSGKVSRDGTQISSSNTATLGSLSLSTPLQFDQSGKISFAINGKTFTFTRDTTLQSMINTINNDATANVTMKYSRLTDTFTIEADSGGASSSVSIVNLSGNAFGPSGAFKISTGTYRNGADAEAVINGTTVTRDSNEFTIDGVTYTLKKVTQGTAEETVEFTLERDFSAAVSSVSKFVDAYNSLYRDLKALLNEPDYSADYPPLTDAQKEEMSESQITLWEKKAKSGLLRNNSDLSRLLTSLRSAFYSPLGGTGKKASEIGLTAAGYFESNAGEIVLDEAALTEALKNNPDEVLAMFTGGSSSSPSSEQGLINKIKSSLSSYTSAVKTSMKAASEKISAYEEDVSELEKKLDKLADKYYARFSKLETALSKLNSQAAFISQLFSTGSSS